MRPYTAPFYFNIRFYLPSEINQKKNSAHLRYIGTRSGVDLGLEIDKDMELVPDTPGHHIKYAHERPRSHGLFSAGDEEVDMSAVQKELSQHHGMVWRVIVSLHGDDAERLDMLNRDAWEEVIKQELPRAAAEMGIQETNLRWVAAYHAEVGHPHAHIVFWEKKPKRRMGKVTPHVKDQMRKKFVQHIYAKDRDRYGKQKTMMRDMMRSKGITTLREAVIYARDWREQQNEVNQLFALTGVIPEDRLSPRMDYDQTYELIKRLERLSEILPGKGRLMLKFMPADVKEEVRQISEWMYNQPQFGPFRKQYQEAAEILARPYSNQEEQIKAAVSRAEEDMINRISQVVLKAAAEINKENHFAIHPDRAYYTIQSLKNASQSVEPEDQQKVIEGMAKLLLSCDVHQEEVLQIIRDWNSRSHSNVDDEIIVKLTKKALQNVNDTKDWGRTPILSKKEFNNLIGKLGIHAEYPWRSKHQRQAVIRGHHKAVAGGLFKSVFKHFANAVRRAEMDRDRAQMQAFDRIRRNAEREQEERERGEGRSR